MKVLVSTAFYARADTAIQRKQVKQVKQMKQMKQTSWEMH